MPLLEDLLLRFRRVWAPPGPVAGQAGVPEDTAATLDDELRELSVELAAIDEKGLEVVRRAETEATGIVAAARAEAESIVQAARARAPAVRAERAAARVRDRAGEIQRLLAGAERDAASIRDNARSRMPAVVDKVVEAVFAHAGASEVEHVSVVGRR